MNKIVTFQALGQNGIQIERAAMLDESSGRIIAFEFEDDETIDFTKLKNKRIIIPGGRIFSLNNSLKIGRELMIKKAKHQHSLNR